MDFQSVHQGVQDLYLRRAALEKNPRGNLQSAMNFWKDQFFTFSPLHLKTYEDLLTQRLSLAEARGLLHMTAPQQQQYNRPRETDMSMAYQQQAARMQMDQAHQQLVEERDRVKALRKELDAKDAHLTRKEAQLQKAQEKVAAERTALEEKIDRHQKQVEERLAEQQRVAAQKSGASTPRAKLDADRKALELREQMVNEKLHFAKELSALTDRERTEVVEAKAALNAERAEMAAQREVLKKDLSAIADRENTEFFTPREQPSRPRYPLVETPLRMPAKDTKKKVHFVPSGSDSDDSSVDPMEELAAAKKRRVPSYGATVQTRPELDDDDELENGSYRLVPDTVKWHTVASWVPYLTKRNAPVFLLQLKDKYVSGAAGADDLTGRLWRQVEWWVLAVAADKVSNIHMLNLGQECLNQLRLRVQKVKEPTTDLRAIQRYVDVETDPSDTLMAAFQKAKPITKGSSRFASKSKSDTRWQSPRSRSRSSSPGDSGKNAALYCAYCRRYGHPTSNCFQKKGKRGGSK